MTIVDTTELKLRLENNTPFFVELARSLGLEIHTLLQQPTVEILLLEVPPGATVPNHFHEAEEYSFLLQGELNLEVDSTIYTIQPGLLICFGKNKVHSAHNAGHEVALVLSIFMPNELHAKWGHYSPESQMQTSQPLSF